jgi:predicted nuclease of predicted toxin-antitoxin system
MRVLLDECVTRRLKRDFVGHDVFTVDEARMKGFKNGRLLQAAAEHYEVLVTVDQNLIYQQNLQALPLAVLILVARRNTYAMLQPLMPRVLQALQQIRPGEIRHIDATSSS